MIKTGINISTRNDFKILEILNAWKHSELLMPHDSSYYASAEVNSRRTWEVREFMFRRCLTYQILILIYRRWSGAFWSHCPVLINPEHLSWQRTGADAQADCSVPSWWVETTHCHFCVHVSFPAISRGSWMCSMNKWWSRERDRNRTRGRESRMMGRQSRKPVSAWSTPSGKR